MSTMAPHLEPPRSTAARLIRALEIVGVPAAGFATAFAVVTSLHGGDAKPAAVPSVRTQSATILERPAVEVAAAPGRVSLSALPRVPALDAPVRKRRAPSRASASTPTTAPVVTTASTPRTTTTTAAPVVTAAPVRSAPAPTRRAVAPKRSSTPSYSGKSFDSSGTSGGAGSGSASFDTSG